MSFLSLLNSANRINVTAVDASSQVGLFAVDGSLNVTTHGSGFRGVYNSCGAINVTVANGSSYVGAYAADGSVNVFVGNGTPYGAASVNDVNGTLTLPAAVADWQFLEGSGTTTADSTGNGNTGTLLGSVGVPTWVNGGGLTFNGANSQYVSIGTNSDLNLTGPMTAWAKVKPTDFTSQYNTIFSKGYDGANEQYSLRFAGLGSSNLDFFTFNGSVFGATGLTSGISASQTHTTCGVFDGSHWRIYVDGAELSGSPVTSAQAPVHSASPVYIGAEDINGSPARFFTGTSYRVRVWNSALNSTQVATLG